MTIHPQYRSGWRAGFVAAERASVRARLRPRTPWRAAGQITVIELIDRLAAERGVGPDEQAAEAVQPAADLSGVQGRGDADDVQPQDAAPRDHRVPRVPGQREGVAVTGYAKCPNCRRRAVVNRVCTWCGAVS